jgi:glycine/D-amino acid oxidase-like deaminating enzyme
VPSAPGVALAMGHYRNGILLAPLTAEIIADWALDDRIDPMMAWTMPARLGAAGEEIAHETVP